MAKRMVDSNSWVRTFEVTEPTRHQKGFTVYKVTSIVFPRSFPESATKITAWKRYSDFRKLHKDLELIFKQLYLKGEFPVFPKAKVFGRFEYEVVEERRKAALVLLEFTAIHIQLFTSKPFMQFFENGYSQQDFIDKILFSKGDPALDPPATVIQEKSEISSPCLQPEILWNINSIPSNEGDSKSISQSSISSSLSPTESPDMALASINDLKPCSSTCLPKTLVSKGINGGTDSSKSNTTTDGNKFCANVVSSDSSLNTNSQYINVHDSSQVKETGGTMNTIQAYRTNGIVRSATVTDELSCYFDEEFEDTAFLFPTGSCSSLDALPGFTPSNDVVDSTQKEIPSSSRSIFTLPRRKTNGFGLFDFLPLFPKKSTKKTATKDVEERKEQMETVKKTSLSVGYICEAAGHFAVAQFHESNADYENAFNAYKEGIRVLLAGAQDDNDRDRKMLAKNKVEKYLTRAESLKETFLTLGTCGNGTISPVFSSPSKKKSLSALTRFGKNSHHQNGRYLLTSIDELKPYKVVGLDTFRSKVLIVMNPEETSPKCYATKVLWKSPSIIYPNKPTIIPCNIPFMVKLLKWFDTPEKIILLLEHAGGGRLEEFVKNYQSKRLSLSSSPEEVSPVDDKIRYSKSKTPSPVRNVQVCRENFKSSENTNAVADADINSDVDVEQIPNIDNEGSSENEIFSTPAPSPPIEDDNLNANPDAFDVERLLENSKALLHTVSKTLEDNSHSPKKTETNTTAEKKMEIATTSINSHENISCNQYGLSKNCTDDPIMAEEMDEGCVCESEKNDQKNSTDEDSESACNLKRMVPEGVVRVWCAEIIIALEALHDVGITYGDLQMSDILLGENGHILLRYKSLWTEIDDKIVWHPYTSPEVRDLIGMPLWKIHPSADWWSLGAILFFLLTGQNFNAAHPEGVYPEMIIKVPDISVCDTRISKCGQTLMKELLQYSPEIRLGYYGAAEIKSHPFFEGFDWEKATEEYGNSENLCPST